MSGTETSRRTRKIGSLSDLALTPEDYRTLRRQGSVCSEGRRGTIYYKLRFRTADGRQRVRYLGSDPAVAESIRCELRQLQTYRRCRTELSRRHREARMLLRQVKRNLAEVIATGGFYCHGFAIRRRNRQRRSDRPSVPNTNQ